MKLNKLLIVALVLGTLSVNAGANLFAKKLKERNFLKINSASLFSSKEGEEKTMTSSGLFLNLGVFIPSNKYLNPYYTSGDEKYGLGFDFEIGNSFRLIKLGPVGLNLRATWLSLGYTSLTIDAIDYTVNALTGSLIRLGPSITMPLAEKAAIDVFYQIGAGYTMELYEDDENSSYLGATHEIGLGFRFKIFNLGVGYRFGKLKNIDNSFTDVTSDDKFATNNIKVCIGIKL